MQQFTKQQRCEQVNHAIKIIADHGRRFFWCDTTQRYARMEVDHRGKIWVIDDYTGKRVYTHPTPWGGRWRGFSHGGTLKGLVERFRDYISHGKQLSRSCLGPERFGDSNIWGYDEDSMQVVRQKAGRLLVFAQPEASKD